MCSICYWGAATAKIHNQLYCLWVTAAGQRLPLLNLVRQTSDIDCRFVEIQDHISSVLGEKKNKLAAADVSNYVQYSASKSYTNKNTSALSNMLNMSSYTLF